MAKAKKSTIEVKGTQVSILSDGTIDFISLSDMTKAFEGDSALIGQWLRNKDTIEFRGIWEQINNGDFNSIEFEGIRNELHPDCKGGEFDPLRTGMSIN